MEEPIVVYQTPEGKLGYRSIGARKGAGLAGNMLMEAMISLGEATQCWLVLAEDGGKAITQVRRIMRGEALSHSR